MGRTGINCSNSARSGTLEASAYLSVTPLCTLAIILPDFQWERKGGHTDEPPPPPVRLGAPGLFCEKEAALGLGAFANRQYTYPLILPCRRRWGRKDIPGLPFAAAKLVADAEIPRIWIEGAVAVRTAVLDRVAILLDYLGWSGDVVRRGIGSVDRRFSEMIDWLIESEIQDYVTHISQSATFALPYWKQLIVCIHTATLNRSQV
jgi:hypothetical protein